MTDKGSVVEALKSTKRDLLRAAASFEPEAWPTEGTIAALTGTIPRVEAMEQENANWRAFVRTWWEPDGHPRYGALNDREWVKSVIKALQALDSLEEEVKDD